MKLHIMNSDGSNKQQLSDFANRNREEYVQQPLQITEIAWSPDDSRILFGHVHSTRAEATPRFLANGGPSIPSNLYLVNLSNACQELRVAAQGFSS